MDCAVLGVGAFHREFSQRAQSPSVGCCCHDSHPHRADHPWAIGSWVAGTQVKAIIKGSTKRQALGAIWSIFIHGEVRGQGDVGKNRLKGIRMKQFGDDPMFDGD